MMFAFEKALFGMTAWPYRIINLLFHALCSVLVALLCARLLGGWKEAGRVSLFAGLVFAVHAVHNSEGASGPRREAARLLLDMERFKFGQNRLLPDLIDELEAVLAGDL